MEEMKEELTTDELAALLFYFVITEESHEFRKRPPEERVQEMLVAVLRAAGFNPHRVVRGQALEEGRPVNSRFPFKVIGQDNEDDIFVTGWLDQLVRVAVDKNSIYGERVSREERIRIIAAEIERSVPLKPIVLTNKGDTLCEFPSSRRTSEYGYFIEHTGDRSPLRSTYSSARTSVAIGVHKPSCGGDILHAFTAHVHQLTCTGTSCALMVKLPKGVPIETYGQLRRETKAQKMLDASGEKQKRIRHQEAPA
jgi:hypothetical protein